MTVNLDQALQLLNLLIIPVLVGQVRLEHRLTKLEGLQRRIGVLEQRAGFGAVDETNF